MSIPLFPSHKIIALPDMSVDVYVDFYTQSLFRLSPWKKKEQVVRAISQEYRSGLLHFLTEVPIFSQKNH